ncbi:MAG: sensor histidine kinase [Ilumatobacter sp.]|uniref:sensor histidine kinase n=1 Tax=Ilumatobacter sp. TaxID=1967498 RepID=UPI00391AB5B5
MARSLTFFGPATVEGDEVAWIRRLRIQFRSNQIYALVVFVLGVVLALTIVDSWWTLLFLGALAADIVFIQVRLAKLDADNFVATGVMLTVALWILGLLLAPLVPFALPILIFMLLVPMLGVAPLLDHHEIRRFIAGSALALTAMTALAVLVESPIEDQLPSWLRNVVVIVGVGVFTIPAAGVLLDTHARHAEGIARLVDSNAALRSSRSRLVGVADAERRRLERDLHDGAQQRLTALSIRLRILASKRPELADDANELIAEVKAAIDELRDLAHGLYPPLLERRGLSEALSAAARRAALTVTVRARGVGRHEEAIETAVYFCCLEAIQNTTKHAGPDATVTIELVESDDRLELQISDDGLGFDPEVVGEGRGLRNMADRVAAVDAALRIETEPGAGVVVSASIPLETSGV